MQVQFVSPGPLVRILPLALALSLVACASSPPAQQAGAAPAPAGQAAEKKEEEQKSPAEAGKPGLRVPQASPTRPFAMDVEVEPPDGKWLVDAEGKEYFPIEIPNKQGTYAWVDGERKQVRVAYGLTLDVLSYDDEKIVAKIYRPIPRQPGPPKSGSTPEEREKILASYRPEIASADRLTLRDFDKGLPRQGQWRNGFAVVDIDGDGHLDVVHGPARKSGSAPAIFLGDGKGNWKRWSAVKFPAVPFDYGDAAAADLNGDGRVDLALGSHLRGVSAMIQDGAGNFRLWSQGIEFGPQGAEGAPAFSSREIELADWNRDGRIDLMAMGEGPSMGAARAGLGGASRGVVVYLNQGDGSWVKTTGGAKAGTAFGDALAVGDLNGDRRLDFVTGTSSLGQGTLVNLGQEDGSWQTLAVATLRPNALVYAVAVADFDRDGHDDFALGYLSRELEVWRSGVDVMYARPFGWERRPLASEESQDGVSALAAGDLDGDGALDLVALTGGGRGWVFLGDGKGGFVREESAEIDVGERGCRGYHAALADLDGDGADELVAGFAGEGQELDGSQLCPSGGSLRAWKAGRKGR